MRHVSLLLLILFLLSAITQAADESTKKQKAHATAQLAGSMSAPVSNAPAHSPAQPATLSLAPAASNIPQVNVRIRCSLNGTTTVLEKSCNPTETAADVTRWAEKQLKRPSHTLQLTMLDQGTIDPTKLVTELPLGFDELSRCVTAASNVIVPKRTL